MKMNTLRSDFRPGAGHYWGERGEWLIAYAIHRESDALDRSNFVCIQKLLPAHSWEIERASHCLVGWVDYLIIDPANADAVAIAENAKNRLEDYPVLNEEHFSGLEMEDANQVWKDCYRIQERIDYMRKFRSQFEFHSFADMRAQARGDYFSGYASELLN